MNWSKSDLEKSNLSHNLDKKSPKTNVKGKLPSKISVEKQTIKTVLWVLHRENKITDYTEEFKFHPTRKWRFDWAIPEMKCAIEYEGLMSKKSRHTTIKGFSGDCEKYNEAVKLGWKVLRYTALNYNNLQEDLENIIKK